MYATPIKKVESSEPYTKKYQHHVTCSYGYKLAFADDKFGKSMKNYFGRDAIYKFIEDVIKEMKYCNEIMKIEFNKGLLMKRKDYGEFQKADICWICNLELINVLKIM